MDTGRLAFTPRATSVMPLAFLAGGLLALGIAITGMSMPAEAATRPNMVATLANPAVSVDASLAKPTHSAARHAARIRKLQAVPFIAFPPRI